MLGIDRSGVDFSGSVHCFSMKARVMYLLRTTTSPGREVQGAPVTIFSVFSFELGFPPSGLQGSPRRCCVHGFGWTSQPDHSPPTIVELREAGGLGQLVPNRLTEYRHAGCIRVPCVWSIPFCRRISQRLTIHPHTVPDQQWRQRRLGRDLQLCLLPQVDAKASHKPTELFVFSTGPIDGEEHLHSMTVSSALGVLYRHAQCPDS